MEWIAQLQEALKFIEEHLLEDINYEAIARHVCMSGYSFHRTFSLMAGMTANEYIRLRRLSLAAQELRQTDISVLDAALKYGYETPESFAKAFARFHCATPRQARVEGTPLRMFNPLVIKVTMEGGTIMDYRIVKKDGERFIALDRVFACEIINDASDHSIPDFWDECHRLGLVERLRELRPEGKRDLYGLCSPKREEDDSFRYGIGVLIDADTDVACEEELLAQGYTIWQTEPCEYVVFGCVGEDADCISKAWSRFYSEFLPQSGYAQTELTDYEIYFEKGSDELFCELWIPIEKK